MNSTMEIINNAQEAAREKVLPFYKTLTKEMKKENKSVLSTSNTYELTYVKMKEISISIDNALEELKDTPLDEFAINESIRTVNENIKRTKQRWVAKDIDNEGPLREEYNLLKGMFLLVNSDDSKFFELTGYYNPKESKEKTIKSLNEWIESNDRLLGEYKYIQTKMEWQIISALSNDVEISFYRELLEEIYKNKVETFEVPKELAQYPMDTTNSNIPVDSETIEKVKSGDVLYIDLDVYEFGDTIFKSRYDVSIFKEQTMSLSIKRLGKLDQEIISYLLQSRDENFYRTREVTTTIGDIVRSISRSRSGHTYRAVRESLFRLQYLTILAVTSELRGFSLKILDNVDIIPVDDKDTVRVLFNEDVVQQVANEQTMLMYRDVVKNFNNDMSLPIMLNLQIERVRAFSRGKSSFRMTYNSFRKFLFIRDKKKSRNIKKITDALDEIVEGGKTLKSYTRDGDNFNFIFYPISEDERRDLFRGVPLKDLREEIITLGPEDYQLSIEDTMKDNPSGKYKE